MRLHDKFFSQIVRHPKTVIFIALLITAFWAIFVAKVRIESSARTILLKDGPLQRFNYSMTKEFGGSDVIVIGLHSHENIIQPKYLHILREVTDYIVQIDGG